MKRSREEVDFVPIHLKFLKKEEENSDRQTALEPAMDSAVDSIDWRTRFQADCRDIVVDRILEILKKYLPSSGEAELRTMAKKFEDRVYNVAASPSDYIRTITTKMLSMETKIQNPSIVSNFGGSAGNPIDPETAVSFLSWSEELDTEPETYGQFLFYLYSPKLGNVLAAKGDFDQRSTDQILYEYWTDELFVHTFGRQFGSANCRRWNNYDDCVNWLRGFISSSSSSGRDSSSSDANTTIVQEAANQGSAEVPASLDCFFKVMIGNFDRELSIPPKYCRIFNHCRTHQRIILRNGSRSWIVVVDNYVMREGWEEFVKDHKIKQGEFIVFNHAEINIYDVKIFSVSGCGKRYPWSTDNMERTTANVIATVAEREEWERECGEVRNSKWIVVGSRKQEILEVRKHEEEIWKKILITLGIFRQMQPIQVKPPLESSKTITQVLFMLSVVAVYKG